MTPEDWFHTARENAQGAELLAKAHLWRQAYSMAGNAVECALKGRIMANNRWNRWPDRMENRAVYTHDLTALARLAALETELERATLNVTPVGIAWLVVKDFTIARRYPEDTKFPVRLGRDMVRALTQGGLLEWLMQARS